MIYETTIYQYIRIHDWYDWNHIFGLAIDVIEPIYVNPWFDVVELL